MLDLGLATSAAEAERIALEMLATLDPVAAVGARHHTVPRFWLERFALDHRVLRRDVATRELRSVNVKDLAVRDFYTFVAKPQDGDAEPRLDSSIEQLLQTVEGHAASVFRRLDESPSVPLEPEEQFALAQFLSFQFVRGVRQRAEIELLGEYWAKTMLSGSKLDRKSAHRAAVQDARRRGRTPSRGNGGWRPRPGRRRLSDEELRGLVIRPHQNEHIAAMAQTSEALFEHFVMRPVTVVDLDAPLLIIGDEPVVVVDGADRQHQPECFMDDQMREDGRRKALRDGREHKELVHLFPTRPTGVALAEQIAVPIAPDRLLVLGAKFTQGEPYQRFAGEPANEIAADLNEQVMAQAYVWAAARPDHPTFADLPVPDRTPLFGICDGVSAASNAISSVPPSNRTQRLRRT